jgi:hypothetical protein
LENSEKKNPELFQNALGISGFFRIYQNFLIEKILILELKKKLENSKKIEN